jgi:signal transduction histidine kinase
LPHTRQALTVLTELISTVTAAGDLADLPGAVLQILNHSLPPAEAGWLGVKQSAGGHILPVAALGYDLSLMRDLQLSPGEALPGCGEGRSPCLFATSEGIADALAALRPETRATLARALGPELSLHNLVVVPLRAGDSLVGALWLGSRQPTSGFVEADLPLLQHVGALIGLALDRAQLETRPNAPAQALAANQTRSEALATLSHELRTPLAAIKGYATALLLDEVEWSAAEQREFLTLIDRECDSVQTMISEVLDSALIDAGHLGIELEPVRLPHLAREVADEIQLQTASHRLVVDFPDDFPLVMCDPRRLRQVLRNILDNAVKYSPDGGLIVMRGEVRPADVVVSIADQGVGIAPEDLIPLFDKYFRVHRTTGDQVPGTGLGLPITRAIVEAHGGRIWAESRLGQGTTFHFSLPRDEQALGEGPNR